MSQNHDRLAAKRFIENAMKRHGRRPEGIVVDGSHIDREGNQCLRCREPIAASITAVTEADPPMQRQYLNNRIEQDHRRIKRRVRLMLGFKSTVTAAAILSGIEMIHMMRKQQASYSHSQTLLAAQFEILAK